MNISPKLSCLGKLIYHADQLLDFERFAPGRIVEEGDRLLFAVAGTYSAAHAKILFDDRVPVVNVYR